METSPIQSLFGAQKGVFKQKLRVETNNFTQLPSLPSRAFNYRLQAELEDLSEGPQELAVLGIEGKKWDLHNSPFFWGAG